MQTPNWAKWLVGITVFSAATVGIVWLSGFVFLLLYKTNPIGITDLTTWWVYWNYYQDDAEIVKRLKIAAGLAAIICYGITLFIIRDLVREVRSLHGDARFANSSEIAASGLLGSTGIIVGKWKNMFLLYASMQFVLLAAPTRSGKGVGIVVPNLLHISESVVVLDIKLENYLITSKYRAENGQEVFLFNPFDENGRTHRYNALGYISDNPRLRVTEILSIGYALYPGHGKEVFFDDAARNLFLGLALYLCETPNLIRSFGELLRQSSGKGQPVKTYLQGLINERNFTEVEEIDDDGVVTQKLVPITTWDGNGLPPLSMECVDALNRFLATSDNTLSSIMATFNTPLTLWASPIVDAATSDNDFDLRDVRKKRMTIYVGIPANKLSEAELLINLFFSQLINLNMDHVLYSKPDIKYTCTLLMDEFAAPGRIAIIDKANAYMAGYGLRLLTIIQSPSQIEAEPRRGYGKEGAGTLITNHALQILFTPKKQSDANEYSEMLGTFGLKTSNLSRQRGGRSAGGYTESESDQKRELMKPQELKEMSQDEEIICLENTKPIRCEKIFYYKNHVFLDRLKSVSPTLSALDKIWILRQLRKIGIDIKRTPSKKLLESVWGGYEIASHVPTIDLDLHEAKVQNRIRPMTPDDVASGIDLSKLAIDMSTVIIPDDENLEPEQVEAFVNSFFGAVEASNPHEYDEFEGEYINNESDEDEQRLDEEGATQPNNHNQALSELDIDLSEFYLDSEEIGEPLESPPSEDDYYLSEEPDFDDTDYPADDTDLPDWLNEEEPILDLSILDQPQPKE